MVPPSPLVVVVLVVELDVGGSGAAADGVLCAE
jgi:hypothetical protein